MIDIFGSPIHQFINTEPAHSCADADFVFHTYLRAVNDIKQIQFWLSHCFQAKICFEKLDGSGFYFASGEKNRSKNNNFRANSPFCA